MCLLTNTKTRSNWILYMHLNAVISKRYTWGVFWKFLTFPNVKSDWCAVWSWFFYWCKELVFADSLDTSNIVIKYLEKFLEALEKKFHLKNNSFVRIFEPKSELQISKSKLFSLLLTYNRIGASYGHDFFTGIKNYFNWTF